MLDPTTIPSRRRQRPEENERKREDENDGGPDAGSPASSSAFNAEENDAQLIVDFTPTQLYKKRRDLLLCLEDQLERFWSATGLNNLVFDNKDGVCGFVCGTLLYVFDLADDSERAFTVQTVVYNVKERDDPGFIEEALGRVQAETSGNREIVAVQRGKEIFVKQDISVVFLSKESYEDFADILESFLDITKKAKKAFKQKKKRKGFRGLFRRSGRA